MCYLQFANSEPSAQSVESGGNNLPSFKAIVHPSLSPTVQILREQEKLMHLQLFKFNRAELAHRLEMRLKTWLKSKSASLPSDAPFDEVSKKCDEVGRSSCQGMPKTALFSQHCITTKNVFERILDQYNEVFVKHQSCKAEEFGNDDFFRARTSEMLDSKRWCEQKLELWLQNLEDGVQNDLSIGIFFYPLQQSYKFWISHLRRQIEESRRRLEQQSAPDQILKDTDKLKELCYELLFAKGLVPSSGINDQDKLRSFIATAAVNSWGEEDLYALLDLIDNIVSIITMPVPDLKSTCIHLAAAHGSDFFLKTVFEYMCKKLFAVHRNEETRWILEPDVVHNQGTSNKGESPLFLAAENGHASCIKVLLQFCPTLPKLHLSPLCAAVSRSHLPCARLLLLQPLINQPSNNFTPLMRAVSRCDVEMVALLLHHGAEVQSCYMSEESDVELMLKQRHVAANGRQAIVELLECRSASNTLDEFRSRIQYVNDQYPATRL
jgi:hypothetical protein